MRCSPEAGLFGTATLTKTGQRESQRRKNPLHVQLLGIFFCSPNDLPRLVVSLSRFPVSFIHCVLRSSRSLSRESVPPGTRRPNLASPRNRPSASWNAAIESRKQARRAFEKNWLSLTSRTVYFAWKWRGAQQFQNSRFQASDCLLFARRQQARDETVPTYCS